MRLGKNMKHAMEFARAYHGWNSFETRERSTREAIRRLAQHGLVEIVGKQFKIKQ